MSTPPALSLWRPEMAEFEHGGDLYAALEELERLQAFAAVVENFIRERSEYITAIENCSPGNSADYWRWQGHAECRRQLISELPWSATDDVPAIKRAARVG